MLYSVCVLGFVTSQNGTANSLSTENGAVVLKDFMTIFCFFTQHTRIHEIRDVIEERVIEVEHSNFLGDFPYIFSHLLSQQLSVRTIPVRISLVPTTSKVKFQTQYVSAQFYIVLDNCNKIHFTFTPCV